MPNLTPDQPRFEPFEYGGFPVFVDEGTPPGIVRVERLTIAEARERYPFPDHDEE